MKHPPIPQDEAARLSALAEYGFRDGGARPELDPLVRIVARMFHTPIAAVHMVGSDHVFVVASTDKEPEKKSRDLSICAHAIVQDDVMVVHDTLKDERFHDNPLVRCAPGIRFYAGMPLRSLSGHALGALCIIDTKPHRQFPPECRQHLRELARLANDRLELGRIARNRARDAGERAGNRVTAHPTGRRTNFPDGDELNRLARTDALTGLPNRTQFYRAVEAALGTGQPSAVFMLDLDGFEDVNNTLGPLSGDEILRAVASRLIGAAGDGGLVSRVGGDEFAVLVSPIDEAETGQLAQRLLARTAEPIAIGGQDVRITASCGMALSPLHAQEAIELIGDADLAMHQGKMAGSGQSATYSPAFRAQADERRTYGAELYRAVANDEFVLFFQPQVRLSDNTLTGAEALIRWQHPTRGLLPPSAFLGRLEGSPLAPIVGAWVIEEACSQAARWIRDGAEGFRIAVNLFGAQLSSGDLPAAVSRSLDRHGLAPEALEIEITENIVLAGDGSILDTLRTLRDMGVQLAFDDFGTGYASLSLLTQYPLTRIKIDRSFVSKMLHSTQDASVIAAILNMARALGLSVTAEGIETEAQRCYLQKRHCAEGQGYLFGKPMKASAFQAALGFGAREKET